MINILTKPKLLRLPQIIGCEKRKIEPIVQMSKSTWYKEIKNGKAPKLVKINSSSYWLEDEVYAYVESLRT